jgi:hypothetical protein
MRHPEFGAAVGTRIMLHDGKTSVHIGTDGTVHVPEKSAAIMERHGYERIADPRSQLLDLSSKKNRDKRFAPVEIVVEAPDGFHSKKVILASSGNARILDSQWRVAVSKPEADELCETQNFKVVGHT